MQDKYLFIIVGVIIGALACFCLMNRDSYIEPIVIRTTKWQKKLADNPVATYKPKPNVPAIPIPDTAQWGNISVEPFHYEQGLPFSVNDSTYEMQTVVYGEAKYLKNLYIETQKAQFFYPVRIQKQIDWKWSAIAFVLGACVMRGVDAVLD